MEEWLWRGGRRRWALAYGFVGALSAIGFAPLVPSGPVVPAVVGGALGGALAVAIGLPGSRQLSLLSPSDRVAVIRAVRQGEPVPDPRLAPSVLAFARVAISTAEKERRRRRVNFIFAALVVAVAAGGTAAGSVRFAAYFWALAVISVVGACLRPGRAERRLKSATQAIRLVEDQMRANPTYHAYPD